MLKVLICIIFSVSSVFEDEHVLQSGDSSECYNDPFIIEGTTSDGESVLQVAIKFINQGHELVSIKEYDKAITAFKEAKKLYEDIYEEKHPFVLSIYKDLALTAEHTGDVHKASEYYLKAFKGYTDLYDSGVLNASFITTMQSAARFYASISEFELALDVVTFMINFCEKNKEDMDTLLIADLYRSRGEIHLLNSDYQSAETDYKKMLFMQKQKLDPLSLDFAATYTDLAVLEQIQKKVSLSRKYFKKALKIYLVQEVQDPLMIAKSYNAVGMTYYEQKRYEKAKGCFEKALKWWKKVYPNEQHPDIVKTYSSLGKLYLHNREFAKAIIELENCLEIAQKVMSSDYHFLIFTCNDLVVAYNVMEDKVNGEKYIAKMFTYLNKLPKEEGNQVLVQLGNLYKESLGKTDL